MEKQSTKELSKGALTVVVGILLVLAPFSLIIGWNIVTLLVFWFVMVPWIAMYLPSKVSKSKNHLIESLAGLVIFYSLMVFLIYEQFRSDYFFVMMVSCGVNLIVVSAINLTRKRRAQAV